MKWVLVIALLLLAVSADAQQPMASNPDGSSRPIPDPTVLTTAAQERSIAALRELLDARFRTVEEEIKQTKAALEFQDARGVKRLDEVPNLIDDKLAHLQALMEEKFRGVQQQFEGNATALAAALLAQKTSVGDAQTAAALGAAKQEANFVKQIDGIQLVISANSKATDDKIDGVKSLLGSQSKSLDDKVADIRNTAADLRTAITAINARGAGQSDSWAYMIAGIGVVLAILGFILPKFSPAVAAPPHYQPYPNPNPNPYPYPYQPQPSPQVSVVPVVPVPMPTTAHP